MLFGRLQILASCLIATALLMAPASAFAEAGEGIKTGNYKLSLGTSLSTSLDTNLFYESAEETDALTAATSLLIEPFVTLSTVKTGRVDLSLDTRVRWQQYLDSEDVVSNQSGLTADLSGGVAFNRSGAVSFAVSDKFVRTNEPPSNPADFPYNRFSNTLGATLGFHPGGKVFQHYLSYDWTIYRHSEEIESLDKQSHNFRLNNYWRFLPRTAVILTGEYGITTYDDPQRDAGLANVDSSPLRITGGLTGLITNRISLRLIGGWGFSFSETGETFSGLLLDTQIAWMFGNKEAGNRLYLGYEQGFSDSSISNFYQYYRPYTGLNIGIGKRVKAGLEVDMSLRSYGGVAQSSGGIDIPAELSDTLVTGDVFLNFFIFKWWTADLRYTLNANFTNDTVANNNFGSEAVRDYTRHAIYLGTTFRY